MTDAEVVLRSEPLGAEHGPALAALFQRSGSACYCSYWHFEDDKNAWLARLAHEPERNRAALLERAGRRALTGVVALTEDGRAVGWMKLERASDLPKIYAQRLYRGLPCFAGAREQVWTVGCFLVEPTCRRRGVARSLLRAGVALARAEGARALEAFPRRGDALGDEELWTGPLSLFTSEGFSCVHEQAQYPVLRRDLALAGEK